MVVVVLVVRLDLRYSHKERLLAGVLVEVVQCKLVDAVGAVAFEVDTVVVLVEHIAVVAVRGELQHVRSAPVAGVAATQFQRNSSDRVVDGRFLFQFAV